MRVLILGGTGEAVALAAALVERRHVVTTSLAGRTREPRPVAGALRVGGFGGAEGLASYLLHEHIDVLVDATHPFASTISANAALAATRSRTRRLALHRPPWEPVPSDDWRTVPNGDAAARALPTGARALLALGRQHLAPFAVRSDVSFIVRAIEPFKPPFPATVLLSRPSADPATEAAMLRAYAVTHLVSRNSGGTGAYAKIAAARMLGLPVIVIGRPPAPPPPLVGSVAEAVEAIEAVSAEGTVL